MHQIRFLYSAHPDRLAGFNGPTSKEGEGTGGDWKGRDGIGGRDGRGKERRRGKGGFPKSPPLKILDPPLES